MKLYHKLMLAVFSLFLLTVPLAAQEADAESKIHSKLLDEIALHKNSSARQFSDRLFRVSVSLKDAASKTSYDLTTQAGLDGLKESIAPARSELLEDYSFLDMEIMHRYNYINGFSAMMSEESVYALASDPRTVSIDLIPVWQRSEADPDNLTRTNLVHQAGYTGDGITIAVIDDALDSTHGAFAGKVRGGYDIADRDSNYRPDCGGQTHGTAVAGVAVGSGAGVSGSAPGADLYFVKLASSNDCGTSSMRGDLAAAIDRIVSVRNTHNIKVINMSLGWFGSYANSTSACNYNSNIKRAVDAATSAGLILFAASGNEGQCNGIAFPSCLSNIISVGAVYDEPAGSPGYCVDSNGACEAFSTSGCPTRAACQDRNTGADEVVCYSNSGAILDILSPTNVDSAQVGGGIYTSFGGTSCASPYAAGVAAALLQANGGDMTVSEMRTLLTSTGTEILDPKNNRRKPRIDAKAALDTLATTTPPTSDTFTNTNNYNIPDNNTAGISSPISVERAGSAGTIDISVRIIHSYKGDLTVSIIAPNGSSSVLQRQQGGSADNIIETWSINASSVNAAGTWRLKVVDGYAQDTGYIDEWSLTFK